MLLFFSLWPVVDPGCKERTMSGSEVSDCVLPPSVCLCVCVCVFEIKAFELVRDDFRKQLWTLFSFVSLTRISVSLGEVRREAAHFHGAEM